MKKRLTWFALVLVVLTVATPLVWASSSDSSEFTPRASERWSRGRIIGQTALKRRVTISTLPNGGSALVWPNMEGELELALIGAQGEVLADSVLPLAEKAIDPQLCVGDDGRLHLLWREGLETEATIQYALLDADGNPTDQVLILSDADSSGLAGPQLVRDAEGRFHALWSDDSGVWWTMLDAEGTLLVEPKLLIEDGVLPLAQTDDTGGIHLAWRREGDLNQIELFYGVLDTDTGEMDSSFKLSEVLVSTRLELEEMALGLLADDGYLFWTEFDRGYNRYIFHYAGFPLNAPGQVEEGLLSLEQGEGPVDLFALSGQQSYVLLAFSEMVPASGNRVELQSAVMAIGETSGEEVVTASRNASVRSAIDVDQEANLHMAWLDTAGFRQYNVVYASTALAVIEQYGNLTPRDALNAVLDKVFRASLVVVGAFPGLVAWALLPFLGLVVYHLRTSEETLETPRSRKVLVIALLAEVALSFAIPLSVLSESSWTGARWVVPSVSVLLAGLLTAFVSRRRGDAQLFATFILFTLLNTAMQLALYLLF